MFERTRKTAIAVAGLGALALGGSAIAGAADNGGSTHTQRPAGRHVGANGEREQALTADVAAKVKQAALAKVSGGTVVRTETDVDHGSPYEAHVRKADGTEVEVLVNQDFQVTAVNEMGAGGPGGPPPAQP